MQGPIFIVFERAVLCYRMWDKPFAADEGVRKISIYKIRAFSQNIRYLLPIQRSFHSFSSFTLLENSFATQYFTSPAQTIKQRKNHRKRKERQPSVTNADAQ